MNVRDYGAVVWWGAATRSAAASTLAADQINAEYIPALCSLRLVQIARVTQRLREMERRIVLRRWKLDAAAEKAFWASLWMKDAISAAPKAERRVHIVRRSKQDAASA